MLQIRPVLISFCYAHLLLVQHVVDGSSNSVNNKKFYNGINQQNLQTLLSSIEERLWNLNQVYSVQYLPTIEGKLENVLRKLEMIDIKIERLEMKFMSEIEKVSSNISNKIYKDEIIKEHILRKLADVYDRLDHKLIYMELKFEMNDKKIEDKLKTITKELHKNNENVLTGLMDTETELEDTLTGIDEIRSSQLKTETYIKNETVYNSNVLQQIQKDVNVNHENLLRMVRELNVTFCNKTGENGANIQQNIQTISRKFDSSDETLNNYFNKITNMNEEMWNKNVRIEDELKKIGKLINETRNEQQNGLRTLTVQFGRVYHTKNNTKEPNLNEIGTIDEKLIGFRKMMEENLENLIATQNMFLESCYRAQMDETDLETRISIVLQKLIDTFEEKTACEPKMLRAVEQILKAHDVSMKRYLHKFLNKTGTLLQKNSNAIDENNVFETVFHSNKNESTANNVNKSSREEETLVKKQEDVSEQNEVGIDNKFTGRNQDESEQDADQETATEEVTTDLSNVTEPNVTVTLETQEDGL